METQGRHGGIHSDGALARPARSPDFRGVQPNATGLMTTCWLTGSPGSLGMAPIR
jgi:hypothetical protein